MRVWGGTCHRPTSEEGVRDGARTAMNSPSNGDLMAIVDAAGEKKAGMKNRRRGYGASSSIHTKPGWAKSHGADLQNMNPLRRPLNEIRLARRRVSCRNSRIRGMRWAALVLKNLYAGLWWSTALRRDLPLTRNLVSGENTAQRISTPKNYSPERDDDIKPVNKSM